MMNEEKANNLLIALTNALNGIEYIKPALKFPRPVKNMYLLRQELLKAYQESLSKDNKASTLSKEQKRLFLMTPL